MSTKLISIAVLAMVLLATSTLTAHADGPNPPPVPNGNAPVTGGGDYCYPNQGLTMCTWWAYILGSSPNGQVESTKYKGGWTMADANGNIVDQMVWWLTYHWVYGQNGTHYTNTTFTSDGTDSQRCKTVFNNGTVVQNKCH